MHAHTFAYFHTLTRTHLNSTSQRIIITMAAPVVSVTVTVEYCVHSNLSAQSHAYARTSTPPASAWWSRWPPRWSVPLWSTATQGSLAGCLCKCGTGHSCWQETTVVTPAPELDSRWWLRWTHLFLLDVGIDTDHASLLARDHCCYSCTKCTWAGERCENCDEHFLHASWSYYTGFCGILLARDCHGDSWNCAKTAVGNCFNRRNHTPASVQKLY